MQPHPDPQADPRLNPLDMRYDRSLALRVKFAALLTPDPYVGAVIGILWGLTALGLAIMIGPDITHLVTGR